MSIDSLASSSALFVEQLEAWVRGIPSELGFWERFLATGGDRWPDDFSARFDVNAIVGHGEPELAAILAAKGPGAEVLDVGSGPVSSLGTMGPCGRVRLQALDPLARPYARMLERHGLVPPVPTRPGQVEMLEFQFAPASFDVVYCRNALDHSFDPLAGIFQMLRVTKLGGSVLLRHIRDEAVNEQYEGLHQWNLGSDQGSLVLWNRRHRFDLTELLPPVATVEMAMADTWINAKLTKVGEVQDTPRLVPLAEQQAAWIDVACLLLNK